MKGTGWASRIGRFLRLPPRLLAATAEAYLLSIWHRIRILTRPFKKIARGLGRENVETVCAYTPAQLDAALLVRRAVTIVARHTPWRCLCLEQAFIAKSMLRRRGVPCTVYLGLRRDERGEMVAHAWTLCGDLPVTGGIGHNHFTVTGHFG